MKDFFRNLFGQEQKATKHPETGGRGTTDVPPPIKGDLYKKGDVMVAIMKFMAHWARVVSAWFISRTSFKQRSACTQDVPR